MQFPIAFNILFADDILVAQYADNLPNQIDVLELGEKRMTG